MYARLLALFGLLFVSASLVRSESRFPTGTEVEVYLHGDSASAANVLDEMNRELATLMQHAGFQVVELHGNDQSPSGEAAHVIVVELRGACAAPMARSGSAELIPPALSLASSAVANGRVLPFSWVDCSALSRFLGPAISGQTAQDKAYIYGRAMARLLAHEFYHVLAQTGDHTQAGICKASFSRADLLADHFDFDDVALARLHPYLGSHTAVRFEPAAHSSSSAAIRLQLDAKASSANPFSR
jgi:hypothetical protein